MLNARAQAGSYQHKVSMDNSLPNHNDDNICRCTNMPDIEKFAYTIDIQKTRARKGFNTKMTVIVTSPCNIRVTF